ncbi:MAG: hypothetical protein AMJ88_18835 [Anaerolineae bacterium SM23_ 63]|nr:MAG: hypothetical protein AMJ88_18835 [Anaerolineae bacterium SM23_ 63]
MTERFVEVDIVMGRHIADLIRSLLEANGIPTELSQESVGAVTGFTVGPMGEVRILVPSDKVEDARKLIEDYYSGELSE